MKAIRKQITGRTILIHNPAPFSIFHHHRQILSLRSVHVDRHRPRALSSGDENHPLPLVLGKAQKISFPIHLKIHPIPPHKCHPARSCRRRSGRQPSRRILISHPKAGEKAGLLRLRGCSLREPPTPLRKTGRQTAITANTIRKQRSRSANSGASNPARATRSS